MLCELFGGYMSREAQPVSWDIESRVVVKGVCCRKRDSFIEGDWNKLMLSSQGSSAAAAGQRGPGAC